MRRLTPVPALRHPDNGAPRRLQTLMALGVLGLEVTASYTVQPGDTLSQVAFDHGVSIDDLAVANGIDDPDRLYAGNELTLAGSGPDPVEARNASTPPGAPVEIEALIEEVATRRGWSPRFVKAIAWQESGFQQTVTSRAGAVGVMQVMPATGTFVSERLVGRSLDLDDPRDNVEAGVVFLQHLWELTDGDVRMTLAGYYQGLRSVRDNGMYTDTERYIDNVLALRDRF